MEAGERHDANAVAGQRPVARLSLNGLTAAAGFLVCLFTITGFAGGWYWLLELTSHFRAQYAVLLTGLGLVLFWRRRHGQGLVLLAFALLNAAFLLPFLRAAPVAAGTSEPRLRLVAWNVNSNNRNHDELDRLIREQRPDLLLLMEVPPRWVPWLDEHTADYPHRVIEPRDDNFGVALLSRVPLIDPRLEDFSTVGLPSITAAFWIGQTRITLLGTHPLPPVGTLQAGLRNGQLERISEWVQAQDDAVIVVGDLNITPWSPVFQTLIRKTGLRNSAEGRGLQGTWPAFLPPMRIPIDHFLHGGAVSVHERSILRFDGSDHLPQLVEFGAPRP